MVTRRARRCEAIAARLHSISARRAGAVCAKPTYDGSTTVSGNLVTMQAEPWAFPFAPATTALLVIDMQNDFTLPGGYCHQYMEARGLGGDDAISTLRTPIAPIPRCLDAARAS